MKTQYLYQYLNTTRALRRQTNDLIAQVKEYKPTDPKEKRAMKAVLANLEATGADLGDAAEKLLKLVP
jgi:Zn-dependent oligopeptidase